MRNAALGTVAVGAVAGVTSFAPRVLSSAASAAPVPSRAQGVTPLRGVQPAQGTIFETSTPTILTADVVIVGFGSPGIPAAIEAFDAGERDIIAIEKASWLGGAGRRNAGGLAAANTAVQTSLGIEDNFNDFYHYLLACGDTMLDPTLVRSFATNDNVDWLINTLGGQPLSEWSFSNDNSGKVITPLPANTPDAKIPATFNAGLTYNGVPSYFQLYGFAPIMRCHWFTGDPNGAAFRTAHQGMFSVSGAAYGGGGTGIFTTLNNAVTERNNIGPEGSIGGNSTGTVTGTINGSISVMPSTTLAGLVASPDGEVLGISAIGADGSPLYIEAKKGVILGTGGWSNNAMMAQDYLGVPSQAVPTLSSLKTFKLGSYPNGNATPEEQDGSGILAALAIGADTVNMFAGGGETAQMDAAATAGGYYSGAWQGYGGLKVNDQAQVINTNGDPIPRLYAAGSVAGGFKGAFRYATCGFAYGSAMWFGRIAGQNVAALRPWE